MARLTRPLVFAALLSALAGCQSSNSGNAHANAPTADVRRWLDDSGLVRNQTRLLTAAQDVNQLKQFFPDMTTAQQSSIHGSWQPSIVIHFTNADGSETYIFSDYRIYRVDDGKRGDFVVAGDFSGYIDRLFGGPAGQ